jgi:hypothetical protein
LCPAHQKLGQTQEAKSCLAEAREFMKAEGIPWNEQLKWKVLHREAEAMLKGDKR